MRRSIKRRGIDPMISMINVVFLLLAFFVMGNFDPSLPEGIELAQISGEEGKELPRLVINEAGEYSFGNALNDEAVALALKEEAVMIAADARLDANLFIGLLGRLRQAGIKMAGVEVKS